MEGQKHLQLAEVVRAAHRERVGALCHIEALYHDVVAAAAAAAVRAARRAALDGRAAVLGQHHHHPCAQVAGGAAAAATEGRAGARGVVALGELDVARRRRARRAGGLRRVETVPRHRREDAQPGRDGRRWEEMGERRWEERWER